MNLNVVLDIVYITEQPRILIWWSEEVWVPKGEVMVLSLCWSLLLLGNVLVLLFIVKNPLYVLKVPWHKISSLWNNNDLQQNLRGWRIFSYRKSVGPGSYVYMICGAKNEGSVILRGKVTVTNVIFLFLPNFSIFASYFKDPQHHGDHPSGKPNCRTVPLRKPQTKLCV